METCFRKERETQWVKTEDQLNENSIVVKGLDPEQVYSFRVVAVDGDYQTPSRVQVSQRLVWLGTIATLWYGGVWKIAAITPPLISQSVNTYLNIAAGPQHRQSTLASSGWFIGMLLAIIFLLGVCLVVCLVKRNRGGKYAVQEQEVAHGRPDYDDGGHDGGFSEYTQP